MKRIHSLLLAAIVFLVALAFSQMIMDGEDGNLLVRVVIIALVFFPCYFLLHFLIRKIKN